MVYWNCALLQTITGWKSTTARNTFTEGLQGRILKERKNMSNSIDADTTTRTDEKRRAHIRCYFILHHGDFTIKFDIKFQYPIFHQTSVLDLSSWRDVWSVACTRNTNLLILERRWWWNYRIGCNVRKNSAFFLNGVLFDSPIPCPRGLRLGSAGSNPVRPHVGLSLVSVVCCQVEVSVTGLSPESLSLVGVVLSGRGLCDGLITRKSVSCECCVVR